MPMLEISADGRILYEILDKTITQLIIPYGVITIGGLEWCVCKTIQTNEIPNTVRDINGFAFDRCTALQSINIPNSVTSIGARIFEDNENLEEKGVENQSARNTEKSEEKASSTEVSESSTK